MRGLLLGAIALLACGFGANAMATQKVLQKDVLPFGVKVNGVENRYPVFGVYALPGEMLPTSR